MRKPGKQQRVQGQLDEYNRKVIECLKIFRSAFAECSIDRRRLEQGYRDVHKAEGEADDIRRTLEDMMYTESVFPESRGDILGLIEAMDRVPNSAEYAVRMVLIQHIDLPAELRTSISELVEVCCMSVVAMINGVEQLFSNYIDAMVTVGKIDLLESEADTIEEELIDRIFSSEIADLQKILLRDLVEHISNIADRAENVGDRIRLMVAKRSV